MDNSIKLSILNGVFALGGTIIGLLFSFLKDWINIESNLKAEKLRLHDKDKINAYKKLYVLIKRKKTLVSLWLMKNSIHLLKL